jgi:hypothetical protein
MARTIRVVVGIVFFLFLLSVTNLNAQVGLMGKFPVKGVEKMTGEDQSDHPKFPSQIRQRGIYLEIGEGEAVELALLPESEVDRAGGWKRHRRAVNRTKESQPIFYASQVEPGEIFLIRLGAATAGNFMFTGREKRALFSAVMIRPGIYRLRPSLPLEPGEYGLGIVEPVERGGKLRFAGFGVNYSSVQASR